jgi:hypothetical protein
MLNAEDIKCEQVPHVDFPLGIFGLRSPLTGIKTLRCWHIARAGMVFGGLRIFEISRVLLTMGGCGVPVSAPEPHIKAALTIATLREKSVPALEGMLPALKACADMSAVTRA